MSIFEKYAPILTSTNAPVAQDERLLLETDQKISIYYAPFEYLNPQAKIVLVGITPGPTQMVNANNEARKQLLSGSDHPTAIKRAKEIGGFSGEPMRSNLIQQLNHWGIHQWLNLKDSSELFGTKRDLLQTASLLRYPVFIDGKDYKGKPNMLDHPLLKRYLFDYFVNDVNTLKDAIFFPLGPEVTRVMDTLVQQNFIDPHRVIKGLLHPSGNNTYRVKYLVSDRQSPLPHATNPEPYDQGRTKFITTFL